MDKKNTYLIVIILIISLGDLLRLYDIGEESTGIDESVTLATLNETSYSGMIDSIELREYAPPLYFFLLKIWGYIFGSTIFSFRMMSFFFSSLSLIVLWLLVDMIFKSRPEKIITLLVASLFVSDVALAQNARLYAFFGFLVVLSFYFLLRYIKTGKNRCLFPLFLTNLALLYTNYLSVFVLALQYVLLSRMTEKSQTQKWSKLAFFSIVASLPAFVLMVVQFIIVYPKKVVQVSSLLPESIASIFAFCFLSFHIILAILLLLGNDILKKKRKVNIRIFDKLFLIAFALFIMFLVFQPGYFLETSWIVRYSMFVAFLGYIAVGYHIPRFRYQKFGIALLAIFLIVALNLLVQYYTEPQKEQWNEAVELIKETGVENFVFVKGSYYIDTFDNYFGDSGLRLYISDIPNYKIESFWLIAARMKDASVPDIELVEQDFELLEQHNLKDLDIYHYVRK